MTTKEFLIDSIKSAILEGNCNTPSCDICGYTYAQSRLTIKGIEGKASLNICCECEFLIDKNDNFELISTDEVY